MKVLHLTLKKKWFDLVASGEKREEYRGITQYWWTRLIDHYDPADGEMITKSFDVVEFRHAYRKNAPTIICEFEEIRIAKSGNTAWGWTEKCFGIKLGKILSIKNYKTTSSVNASTEEDQTNQEA